MPISVRLGNNSKIIFSLVRKRIMPWGRGLRKIRRISSRWRRYWRGIRICIGRKRLSWSIFLRIWRKMGRKFRGCKKVRLWLKSWSTMWKILKINWEKWNLNSRRCLLWLLRPRSVNACIACYLPKWESVLPFTRTKNIPNWTEKCYKNSTKKYRTNLKVSNFYNRCKRKTQNK